ncbi:DUF4395 domain-containing protein [Geothrix alkalitolerans]|uniref:DUF4395 domain-containing protein n=1 Tax=Geothrix alkalitolerans TaxID=2922724 RepID=UPI001FB02696|nr:DUF4395 domain-containing protein [Geothrix alkalitolerans]
MNQKAIRPGPSCPITPDLTDESAGRIAAFLSLALLGVCVWPGRGWAVLALAADFLLRAAGRPAFSPVARAAGALRRWVGLPERRINAGPKRFAASVGSLISLGIGLAFLAELRPLGLAMASILGTCAGLEAFFGFCLACRIHPWLPWVRSASAQLLATGVDEPAL